MSEIIHEPHEAAPVQADPKAFKLAGDPPKVMRLSRKALALLGLVAGIGIGGSLLYALRVNHAAPPQNLYETSSHAKPEVVTAAPASYDKVPKLGAPLPGDLGRPILNAQANGQMVPIPPMGKPMAPVQNPRGVMANPSAERMVQERDSARTSRMFFASSTGGSGGSAQMAAVTPVAATTTGGTVQNRSADAPTGQTNGSASQGEKRSFLEGRSRATVSAERLTAPVSPYIIQAGSIIPAALITGIRSDLPGQITAQVTQNVYDSPTGKILLIRQGSRLVGEYDSEVAAGQSRVLLAWDRLILPDGRSIVLERQPGTDASGYAGLQDRVNYHWGNMLHAAAISTLLGAGTELATNSNDALTQALRYGTQDTVNQVGKQLIQREMNVQPTITIRPGFALRVIVTRDLVLASQRVVQ